MTSVAVECAGGASLLILLWLVYRYSLFIPATKGLPILLYHKVSPNHNDSLTISTDRLNRQLEYIKSSGYVPISFLDLNEALAGRRALPAKPVIITFDDGYLEHLRTRLPAVAEARGQGHHFFTCRLRRRRKPVGWRC